MCVLILSFPLSKLNLNISIEIALCYASKSLYVHLLVCFIRHRNYSTTKNDILPIVFRFYIWFLLLVGIGKTIPTVFVVWIFQDVRLKMKLFLYTSECFRFRLEFQGCFSYTLNLCFFSVTIFVSVCCCDFNVFFFFFVILLLGYICVCAPPQYCNYL